MSEKLNHNFNPGDECTFQIGSDRYPVMVSRVTKNRVYTKSMEVVCIKPATSYGSEDAEFKFLPPKEGAKESCFTVKGNGKVSMKGHRGGGLSHGADYYMDPSF